MERTHPFLQGEGEMSQLTRGFNWSATSLGPPDRWPLSLRTTIGNLLNSAFPMFLFWGSDLTCFYNDAYRPSLGLDGKHPALGKRGKDVWPEIWSFIGPLIEGVLSTGKPVWFEDQLLPIYRNGRLEDVYWTFSYGPAYGDDGTVHGVLVTCMETTEKVSTVKNLVLSEQRFHNLIQDATVGIAVLSGSGMRVEIVNREYGRLVGRDPADLLGKDLFDRVPETEERFRPFYETVRQTGEPVYLYDQTYTVNVNGKAVSGFLNLVCQPYYESDGTVIGVMALCQDVTEQVVARKKAEESAQQVRSLVESAPFPIGVYTGREMMITFVNQSIIDVWGKGGDVVGKRYADVLPELASQEIYPQLDAVYTTGKPFHARNKRVDLVVDGKLQPFYFNYSFTPLFDAEGRVYGVMNTAANVTDLNVAKQKLERSEENLRNMILQAPVAMCILKGPGQVVEIANDLMLRLWGSTREQVLFKSLFEGLPEVRNQGFENLLHAVYTSGKTYKASAQAVNLPRDGRIETVYVDFVYEAFREGDGSISGVMVVAVDVTEQVLARQKIEEVVTLRTAELAEANEALTRTNRELKRSNENLEEFAFAASHDLKEPIRKIHFFSDRIRMSLQESFSPEDKRSFEKMQTAAKRMNALIEDLLAYSQVSLLQRELELVNLDAVLQTVMADLDVEMEERKAVVELDPLCTVKGHPRQLQQVFQNLLGNALKYCRPGVPPQVRVSSSTRPGTALEIPLSSEEKQKDFCVVTVKDNGIGFDQADADRIFNVFTRLHGNSEYRGTGLGLSIVRKVIENHHGYVQAKGRANEGAEFTVYLPV